MLYTLLQVPTYDTLVNNTVQAVPGQALGLKSYGFQLIYSAKHYRVRPTSRQIYV